MGDTHHEPSAPKLDMQKIDGTSPKGWVSQMEHLFLLNSICTIDDKYQVSLLFLDAEHWQWWKWHKQCMGGHKEWSIFSKVLCAHFDQEGHYLGRLTELH